MPSTQTYLVDGMTCGHCVSAVTDELSALSGVQQVAVSLVTDGSSEVTITSTQPLDETQVAGALDEAGDYRLAPR